MSELALQHERWTEARERLGSNPRPKTTRSPGELFGPFYPAAPVSLLGSSSWRRIVTLVALKHGVTVDDILGASRSIKVMTARHEAYWLCRTHLVRNSFPRIAYLFGGRDHSTVCHSISLTSRFGLPPILQSDEAA